MAKFTFVVCTEPYKYQGIESMLNLANTMLAKGHEIDTLFLYGSGVMNLKKDISTGSDTRNIPAKLADFVQKTGVKLVGCTTWIGLCGLKACDFIENGVEEGLGDLATAIKGSDKVVFFGSGT